MWLRDHFSTITDASSDDDIEFATRAFLLHLVGCTLFADKSATSVAVVYSAWLVAMLGVQLVWHICTGN